MVGLAAMYAFLSGNGIWYPMNLLVVGLFPGLGHTATQIGTFNLQALIVAVPLQLMISLLVGMLYGAMLPMASRRPILLAVSWPRCNGPFSCTGTLAAINPVMNSASIGSGSSSPKWDSGLSPDWLSHATSASEPGSLY